MQPLLAALRARRANILTNSRDWRFEDDPLEALSSNFLHSHPEGIHPCPAPMASDPRGSKTGGRC
jgi:hypothetical protein